MDPARLLVENRIAALHMDAVNMDSEIHTSSSLDDGKSNSNTLSWAPAADENLLEDTLPLFALEPSPPHSSASSSTNELARSLSVTSTLPEYVLLEEHCLNAL